MSPNSIIKGNILDVSTGDIFPGEIYINNGYILDVVNLNNVSNGHIGNNDFEGILIPGLIDAHIHIESSFLSPSQFAKVVISHGTTAVINDPHEIANIAGIPGIEFMIESGKQVPMDFYFTPPYCVPPNPFESFRATLDANDINLLLSRDEFCGLGEMMNFPGVINGDLDVIAKLNIAKSFNKPIDGHAPGLSGSDLVKYVNGDNGNNENNCGDGLDTYISTDHECSSYNEAIEKKNLGMKILIREGSSAKNMEAILNINDSNSCGDFEFKDDFLVCDDIHPNDLLEGHVNELIKKAINCGVSPVDAISMVTINPAKHYNLDSGSIEIGKKANIVLIDNLEDFNILEVYYAGNLVAKNKIPLFESNNNTNNTNNNVTSDNGNNSEDIIVFNSSFNVNDSDTINYVNSSDFDVIVDISNAYNVIINDNNNIRDENVDTVDVNVIGVIEGEITTKNNIATLNINNNIIEVDINNDILKIAVINRYGNINNVNTDTNINTNNGCGDEDGKCNSNDKRIISNITNGCICGFGLKKGAIASSFAHDSHNIIVVGCDSESMANAVNNLIKNKGGISVYCDGKYTDLELPIGGIMSREDAKSVAKKLDNIHNALKDIGCVLSSPITTLSFMSLLVIPKLKLSDKGLFDVDKFEFIDLIR